MSPLKANEPGGAVAFTVTALGQGFDGRAGLQEYWVAQPLRILRDPSILEHLDGWTRSAYAFSSGTNGSAGRSGSRN